MNVKRIAYLAQHGSTARIRKKNQKRLVGVVQQADFAHKFEEITRDFVDKVSKLLTKALDRAVRAAKAILEDPELMSKIVHNIQEEPHD